MRIFRKLTPLATLAILSLFILPASASEQGSISSIELQDANRNGRLDRVVIEVQNPDHHTWTINDPSGLNLFYSGFPLRSTFVFFATPQGANPMLLEMILDEDDPNLPLSTSNGGFELEYFPKGIGQGIDDGSVELQEIVQIDTDASNTEQDKASPILLSSDPVAGEYRILRNRPVILNFSEPIDADSLTFNSSNNPGDWVPNWSTDGKTISLQHSLYRTVVEVFTVTSANDLSGNPLTSGTYPNPFSFETTSDNTTQTPDHPYSILAYTTPQPYETLLTGTNNLLQWYSNQSEIQTVRLSYSTDGGTTYAVITTSPVSLGAYSWYPPNLSGSLKLKLEGLNAQGVMINLVIVTPLTLAEPTQKSTPLAVIGPTVSSVTETSTTIRMILDLPPANLSLVCNGLTLNENIPFIESVRPITVSVSLTDLTENQAYSCQFLMIDLFDRSSTIAVPAFSTALPPTTDQDFVTLADGDLIKSPGSSAVYWYKDGKRQVFPNETIFYSWFSDFSGIVAITADQLASISIGSNIRIKADSHLIKIVSDPKVYAVEPDGTLRWVPTESRARELYGTDWSAIVRDINVSFFVNYQIGDPLADDETPAGYQPR